MVYRYYLSVTDNKKGMPNVRVKRSDFIENMMWVHLGIVTSKTKMVL
jgi:hypothetical protein